MEFFENIILKTEVLDENNTFEMAKDDLHIAFGIDANFAIGMGVCMTSIILNNPSEKINFHVFTDGISQEDIERLKRVAKYENVKIMIYYIDKNVFKTLPTTMAWSYAIYYRFIMANVLYGSVDKVLYLDADILCIGSLKEFIEMDMGHCIILGICDFFDNFKTRMQELSIKNGKYFNSGVMYIDVNKWYKEKISESAMKLLIENPQKYKSFDQDVLNVLLDGKTQYVDKKWDYIYNMVSMNHNLPENTVLIHYTEDKPWQRWTEHHFMVKRYYEYIKKSPWSDVPLAEPVHYKEKRKMAKSYKKRGMYLESLKCYCNYLISRTKTKLNS